MVLSEFLNAIRARGASPSETQLRWAYKSNRLPRPRLDGSHRFNFTDADVDAAVSYFTTKFGEVHAQC